MTKPFYSKLIYVGGGLLLGVLATLATQRMGVVQFITGPSPGDIYENLLTRARLQIDDVGTGSDLASSYQRLNETVEGLDLDGATRFTLLRIPVLSDSDSLLKCVSFEEEMRVQGVTATVMKIVPVGEFLETHRRIE